MLPGAVPSSDFARRLLFTLAALVVYRLGSHLPLPGIDAEAFARLLSPSPQAALAGLFPRTDATARISILALGVMPYLSSCILLHAVAAFYPPLRTLRRQGPPGWPTFNQYVRVGAVLLAALQGYGIAVGLEGVSALVPRPGLLFRTTTVLSLVAGTMFLVWLGERILARGVTDGIWLLLAAGYIENAPANVAGLIEAARIGVVPAWFVPGGGGLVVALVALIVLVERAERALSTAGAGSEVARRMEGTGPPARSFRLDNTGVLAPMTASALLLLTVTLGAELTGYAPGWVTRLAEAMTPGRPLHVPLYALLIMFFVFFFTRMIMHPQARPDAPGPHTEPEKQAAEGDAVLTRLTLIGALYLAVLCIAPELMINVAGFPFYVGGAWLLASVLVALDVLARARPRGRVQ